MNVTVNRFMPLLSSPDRIKCFFEIYKTTKYFFSLISTVKPV